MSLPDDTLVLCSGQWNLIARTTEVQSKNNITGICTQKDCLAFLYSRPEYNNPCFFEGKTGSSRVGSCRSLVPHMGRSVALHLRGSVLSQTRLNSWHGLTRWRTKVLVEKPHWARQCFELNAILRMLIC